MPDTFSGFPKDFFAFFRELKQNNERPWFEANKQRASAAAFRRR